MLSLSARWL